MKTKQILSEYQFKKAVESSNETTIQNHSYLYFDFGTYGAKLINAKTGKQKILNFFRSFNYADFCNFMDKQLFE